MIALLLLLLAVPDPQLTPGVARPLTRQHVCTMRWGRDARHVTTKMKQKVAAAYHVPWSQRARYEFDHLIPRELGGDDVIENLWPQPIYEAKHVKDPEENRDRKSHV